MEPLDLDEIKARLEKATPGPWQIAGKFDDHVTEVGSDLRVADCYPALNGVELDNADLIAHAPDDLAALIAEVEKLRDGIRVAIETIDEVQAQVTALKAAGLVTP